MRYVTSNPLERLMMQAPPPRQEQRTKPAPSKDHPCYGCKRCGKSCVLPCCRGVEVIPPIIMVYKVDEAAKTVHILRFFYDRRDYEKLI